MGGYTEIDKALVAQKFASSATSYNDEAKVQRLITEHLTQLLLEAAPTRHYARALEVGCGTGMLTNALDSHLRVDEWVLNDLQPESLTYGAFSPRHTHKSPKRLIGDAETLDLGQDYDLIATASTMQWFSDPKGFVQSLYPRLRAGGILLCSTFAPDNLYELRSLTKQGLTYYNVVEVSEWFADYQLLHLGTNRHTLYFDSALALLRHLKATGVNGLGTDRGQWTKGRLEQFEHAYRELYPTPGGALPLTYTPIYMVARKPNPK